MAQPFVITTPEELEQIVTRALQKHLAANPATAAEPAKDIIDINELCKRLNLSLNTIVTHRKKGKIPFLMVGNSIRYDYNAVLKKIQK